MSKKFAASLKFFRRNQIKILTTALVVTTIYAAALTRNKKVVEDFLKEHDLYNEYYTPEES